jgi:hypothetical protein
MPATGGGGRPVSCQDRVCERWVVARGIHRRRRQPWVFMNGYGIKVRHFIAILQDFRHCIRTMLSDSQFVR